MELSDRKKRILKAIVETFVQTAEPVGSKTIAADTKLGLSSATIRNEMAELTSLGYLEQPHTSAGRVPSPQGYRMYVNELMNEHKLSLQETQEINKALKQKMSQLDQLLADAGKLVSDLTNYPAYTLAAPPPNTVLKRFDCIYVDRNTVIAVAMLDNNTVKNKLMSFPEGVDEAFVKKLGSVFNANFTGIKSSDINPTLISAAERSLGDEIGAVAALSGFAINALEEPVPKKAFIAGASNLLTQPEYKDVEKAHRLLSYISEGKDLMQIPPPEDSSGIRIMIGPENIAEELKDSGVVVASYDLGNNTQGLIGVVGPTRMDYAKVAAYLSYIADGLKRLALGSDIKPQLEDTVHREEG
ncbi:MAG: heat-inducible transcription repressor HrcA [Papillibacter sp.]|nr:heat-inducible transcription repressor HrcA [Papillibacter sp.]